MILADAIKENKKFLHESVRMSNGFFPQEADDTLNKSNISIIKAMEEEYGEAWLVKVNLYGNDRSPIVRASTSGDNYNCYNFCCSLVMSKYNEKLEKMILARLDAEYTGTRNDATRVEQIYKYAETLGAIPIVWS